MKYEYWFANIKGIGNQKKKRIRKRLVSAQELYYIEETGLQALGVEEKDAQIIRKSIETWDLEEEYERMQQKKIQFYPFFHSDYPEKLKQISSPPYALYVKGRLPKEDRLSVAIVGARECSPYGRQLTKEFAKKLASAGAQIISGMAKGIDGAGQIGALEEGGDSYGFWGAGWMSVTLENTLSCIRSWKEKAGFYQSSPSGQSRCRSFSLPEIELSVDFQISYL